MNFENLMREARAMEEDMIKARRTLHGFAETGFDLMRTRAYVKEELQEAGLKPSDCGKAGVVALVGNGTGKTFLLRADMDALPVKEEAGEPFSAKNGNMHACGHDLHTAMLLGAAKLLKAHEGEIRGKVKLMFEPAEELLEGAKNMIASGILEDPVPEAALMIHVMTGVPLPVGTVVVCAPGISAPAVDFFTVEIRGKGCHGAMPNTGIDPVNVGAHIVLALQEIHARELSMGERAALTIGSFHTGDAANVIPDTVVLTGSLRAFEDETRELLKRRLQEIAEYTAQAFRAEAFVSFTGGCPALYNDPDLSVCAEAYLGDLLGKDRVLSAAKLNGSSIGLSGTAGSEDFAYVSQKIPSLMLALGAGEPQEGYRYPLHHPKAKFHENAIVCGAAVFAYTAMRWLDDHSDFT